MAVEPAVGPHTRQLWQGLERALPSRYALKSVLGAGGFGTVFAARELQNDRRLALEVLRPETSPTVPIERLIPEIRISASLPHLHMRPFASFRRGGRMLYYVMPSVNSHALADEFAHV